MRKSLVFLLPALALIPTTCAPAVAGRQDAKNTPTITVTPGSMTADNPEAAHMMEPISALNVPLATKAVGGHPLAFREEVDLPVQ